MLPSLSVALAVTAIAVPCTKFAPVAGLVIDAIGGWFAAAVTSIETPAELALAPWLSVATAVNT